MDTHPLPTSSSQRLHHVDVLRGIAMLIMAIDHSRDLFSNSIAYFDPADVHHTTVAIFFTRWITDYCAPVFSFLAGCGVFLSVSHGKPRNQVSRLLLTRGVWLILLDLLVIKTCWFFKFDNSVLLAGVLWCLGWSMLALAAFIHLPRQLLFAISLGIIAGHNLLDPITFWKLGAFSEIWTILHGSGLIPLFGGINLLVLYALIPWIGVMAAGYCFGEVLILESASRRRVTLMLGCGLTLLFLAIRGVNGYGDPEPWSVQPSGIFTLLSFLACDKYPPSLCYLLMTLGPSLVLLSVLDRPTLPNWLKPVLVFGQVPFLFYVLHIPLLHAASIGCALWRYGSAGWLISIAPGLPRPIESAYDAGVSRPMDFTFDLPLTYVGWLLVVLTLYPVCRRFAKYKSTHSAWWLSYL